MIVDLVAFSCLVAAAAAVVVPGPQLAYPAHPAQVPLQPAPVAVAAPTKVIYAEPDLPPQYEYEYSVQDPQSGDVKSQKETRNGDNLHGYYSLIQPDGIQRIVEYTSSKEHGFNAVVRYEGTPHAHPTKVLAPAPVAYAPAKVVAPAQVAYAPAPPQLAFGPAPASVGKVAYAPPAPLAYAPAPVGKITYAPAPVSYAPAPVSYAPAPVSYAPAPVAYAQAPVGKITYAAQAPVAYAPAPVAKVAYPAQQIAYPANLGRVTYSSPVVSYQH